ncbi:MAG: helix-turn-helix transcriptional regulator [Eubacterium sp.]|nr:helix-turn-helix transcriptional regulator [Eubacterium sp.]MDD7209118.1 helix-turn-helix transcriptional regulator [Lachnospiraceae bacterium]
MTKLQTNDWLILNSIIYEIYTTENFEEMREKFLEQMKMVVDFDSADFYLASEDGEYKLTDPVTFQCDPGISDVYDIIDYSRGIMYSGKSIVYRETDIISDALRMETEYYKKVYRPNNWHYSLQMIMAKDKKFLGVVTFYRNIGKDDFSHDEVFLVDMLKDHMSYRLWKEQERKQQFGEKLTVSAATKKYGLTKQEHKILKFLMEGRDNETICDLLSISINTLKKHILNIYRKLGIRNRVQLFKKIREKE